MPEDMFTYRRAGAAIMIFWRGREVKTMRGKIASLCRQAEPTAQWGNQLAVEWMAANGQNSGYYYIDGHGRVYHGEAAHRNFRDPVIIEI